MQQTSSLMRLMIFCYKRKDFGFQSLWLSIKVSVAHTTEIGNAAQNNPSSNRNCNIVYMSN